MASNPPGPCCYHGVKHEGEPTGSFTQIGDVETYIAQPKDKSTDYGILVITDVIGHRFPNAQLIADQFAANGYFVLMPDLFDGDPIPLNRPGDFEIKDWLDGKYHKDGKAHLPPQVDPIVDAMLVEMKQKYGCKVSAVVHEVPIP